MSPPSDSDILVITTESDNTQDSTKIIYTKKETECLSDDSSDPVIDVTNSAEVSTYLMSDGSKKYDCHEL